MMMDDEQNTPSGALEPDEIISPSPEASMEERRRGSIQIADDMASGHSRTVERRSVENVMEDSYLRYSMSVIIDRALPDVLDGLKPVHRRIMFTMYDSGLRSTTRHRKSATVVGDVMGKYH